MRRSGAPSQKSKQSTSTSKQTLPSTASVINAVKRSSSYVLNILKEMETNLDSPQTAIEVKLPLAPKRLLTENVPVQHRKLGPIITRKAYSVLWAKKSTSMHKKWDGDGILELVGRCGVVKDEEGTRIGQMSNLKPDLIVPGTILAAGRVDIEIKELIPTGSQKVISTKRIIPKEQPRPKRTSSSSQPMLLANLLIMPKPSKEHEWVFNTKNARVNEVTVTYCLAKVLRSHQRLGVIFMYGCVTGIYQINRFGAILADEMGMGKTLQCITLIWTLLHQGPYGGTPIIKKALIVTPSTLTGAWEKEFYRWLGRSRIRVFVANARKQSEFSTSPNPVYIISYEMLTRHYEEVSQLSFDLVICDEGHRLKNALNKAYTLLSELPCKRRIILTATRIQNDLQEFFALSDFVNPGCLGTNEGFTEHFVTPILESREPTADEHVKALGLARSTELNKITSGFILRRSHDILGAYLPSKTETVVFCRSSPLQQDLYASTVEAWDNRDVNNKDLSHLSVMMILKKICNHPSLIMSDINASKDEFPGSLRSLLSTDTPMKLEESGKVQVLLNLLKRVAANDEKIVIVSSYTQTLGMLANLCEVKDYKYVRLDGTVSSRNRLSIVSSFNNPWSKIFVFLLSDKAGGLGLNLSGASRLVLFDSDWNPATDLQAMSRIWRDGQKHSVFLYRFLTTGTIEEKIYQRQVAKTGISGTVVDPANTSSIRFSEEELKDVFNYQFYDDCATHSLLNCKCKCDGSVPDTVVVKEEPGRDPQLDKPSTSKSFPIVKMSQLMKLEHHKPPYEGKDVEALLLSDSYSEISFMFRDPK